MAGLSFVKHFDRPSGGYTVNYKYLMVAYLIEAVVVATSLFGAWLFAQQYGGGETNVIWMMMLAPLAYACVELARVPLAFSMRVQTSKFWKVFFAVMVLAAAAVTVKSLSQLGEVMFRPRMHDVTMKHTALKDAKDEQASVRTKIKSADTLVDQRAKELFTAEDRLKAVNSDMSTLAKPQCATVSGTNRNGQRFTTQRCTPDPRVNVMAANLKGAQESRLVAAKSLDAAQAERAKLDSLAADRKVGEAEVGHRHAVMESQLHSFTGMFFGKAPTDVTDGEIHFFLRWFVFFPAIFAALTATALALASVVYDEKVVSTALDDRASDYILEPLAQAVTERAVAASLAAVKAANLRPVVDDDEDKIVPIKGAAHG